WSGTPSCGLSERIVPRLGGRSVPQALDDPLGVVPRDERADDLPCLLEVAELVEIEALFLERPHEPLGAPVALRLPDERRRVAEAPALDLVHERVRRVLAAPVVTQGHAEGDLRRDRAEGRRHALADRLAGPPPRARPRDVPAQRPGP